MIRSSLALALLLAAAPSLAALPLGAKAPNFSTQGALAGKAFDFTLRDALKKGPVVLYFFPAAFTTGCTIEAHEFAEATDDFHKLGATVIGMSADPIDKLQRFSTEECRNKFAVASASPEVIKEYDAVLPQKTSLANRVSYVIAPDGKIIFAYTAMKPDGHVTGTMDAVRKWKASKH